MRPPLQRFGYHSSSSTAQLPPRSGRGLGPRRRYNDRRDDTAFGRAPRASSARGRPARSPVCSWSRPLSSRSIRKAKIDIVVPDGGRVAAGAAIARVTGNARALLTAERVAINFLGHLSGIATADGTLRREDCRNARPHHRYAQDDARAARISKSSQYARGAASIIASAYIDAILIKDNHIVAAGGVGPALESARSRSGHMVKVEVEVTSLAELNEALAYAPDAVLLDNMDLATLAQAVELVAHRAVTEASGGVTLETVREIANPASTSFLWVR